MSFLSFFFFLLYAPSYTQIYTLSLHDALPIYKETKLTSEQIRRYLDANRRNAASLLAAYRTTGDAGLLEEAKQKFPRSEEHTSELQSRQYLVCRLLLEKKKYIF